MRTGAEGEDRTGADFRRASAGPCELRPLCLSQRGRVLHAFKTGRQTGVARSKPACSKPIGQLVGRLNAGLGRRRFRRGVAFDLAVDVAVGPGEAGPGSGIGPAAKGVRTAAPAGAPCERSAARFPPLIHGADLSGNSAARRVYAGRQPTFSTGAGIGRRRGGEGRQHRASPVRAMRYPARPAGPERPPAGEPQPAADGFAWLRALHASNPIQHRQNWRCSLRTRSGL